MLGLFVGTISDAWHQELSLETPPDTIVNTLRLTPVLLQEENQGGFNLCCQSFLKMRYLKTCNLGVNRRKTLEFLYEEMGVGKVQ